MSKINAYFIRRSGTFKVYQRGPDASRERSVFCASFRTRREAEGAIAVQMWLDSRDEGELGPLKSSPDRVRRVLMEDATRGLDPDWFEPSSDDDVVH